MYLLAWFTVFAIHFHLFNIDPKSVSQKSKRSILGGLLACFIVEVIMLNIPYAYDHTDTQIFSIAAMGIFTGLTSALYIVPTNKVRISMTLVFILIAIVLASFEDLDKYLKL